jgi:transcriptional regulator with XRE-family HTH domain
MYMTEVQEVIEKLRAKGWTTTAIARGVGVTDVTLHRWRRGENVPGNVFLVMRALRQLLDQPVPRRRYRRRK